MIAGVAGLRAHQSKMDVIGNNIANVNTWGFKGYSYNFKDSMYTNSLNSSGGSVLALYAYEADVVGLLLNATEPYSLYPPCCTACCTRPVIGIVTQIDHEKADVERAHNWLALAGCRPIFHVSSYTGEGIWQILDYLREPGDSLPWDSEQEANHPRMVLSDKFGDL